ncbi:MAG: O-antigen ligase family protein [Lentisphaerota bacterium]
MELKHIAFFSFLFMGIPVLCLLAAQKKWVENAVFFITIFFTCSLLIHINFVSMEDYRGTAKGFELTLVDMTTLILFYLVVSRRGQRQLMIFPPGTFIYGLYFIFSAISIANSAESVYSYFELWKMGRMYLFYWTMCNYLSGEKELMTMLKFIPAVIIYIFLVVLDQKYRMHLFQTNGPLPHQNSLVMYMTIFNTILFAWLLNSEMPPMKALFILSVFGMGSICIVSTLSRAGLMCFGLGCGVTLMLSIINGASAKTFAIIILVFVGAAAVLVKSADTIVERFTNAPEQSKLTRISLAEAAVKMANDKFFGIGLNNWGIKINPPYPYSDHIERKDEDFKEGIVETVYLLVAAETGWLNLGVFLLFIFKFYVMNIMNFFRYRKTELVLFSAGLAGGLFSVYLESTLEWVLKQTNNFYQLMLVFAVISAMTQIRKMKEKYGEPQEEEEPGSMLSGGKEAHGTA